MISRLKKLGATPDVIAEFENHSSERSEPLELGRVCRVDRGECDVILERRTVRVLSDSQRSQDQIAPVTGDWVAAHLPADQDSAASIDQILPRRNEIKRRDPQEAAKDQTLAANVNTVAIVCPLDIPARFARIERFLVLAVDSGSEPLVIFTKADIATPQNRPNSDSFRENYGWISQVADVLVTSVPTQLGLPGLRDRFSRGETMVMLGPSGAGKSRLVNALAEADVAAVGAVRKGDRRGRHTTVRRELIELPDRGSIIDTPGIRSIGLWSADIALESVFGDISETAEQCRFRDCSHENEPDCAVKKLVEEGKIEPRRLAHYLLLRDELASQAAELEQRSWRSNRARSPRRRGKN